MRRGRPDTSVSQPTSGCTFYWARSVATQMAHLPSYHLCLLPRLWRADVCSEPGSVLALMGIRHIKCVTCNRRTLRALGAQAES